MISPGQALRFLLRDHGWTQQDLAEILDRPEQWVSDVCHGEQELTPRDALALEVALGGCVDATAWLANQSRWQLALLGSDDSLCVLLEAIQARVAARGSNDRAGGRYPHAVDGEDAAAAQ